MIQEFPNLDHLPDTVNEVKEYITEMLNEISDEALTKTVNELCCDDPAFALLSLTHLNKELCFFSSMSLFLILSQEILRRSNDGN